MTRQTTIMTTDLNEFHLSMIQHFKESPKVATQPEDMVRLLLRCFSVVQGWYTETADDWEGMVLGKVCSGMPAFLCWMGLTLSFRQKMALKTLDSSADHHQRVRKAEIMARTADQTRGDLLVFQDALTASEQYFRDNWCRLNLNPATRESFGALFAEQKQQCVVTSRVYDSLVTRFDRFLNLVWCLRPHFDVCLIENVTAAELH